MSSTSFQHLPIEINTAIASYLNDKDLCSFTLVCRHTHAVVNYRASPLWRDLFSSTFDLQPGSSSDKLKLLYQVRKDRLRTSTSSALSASGRSSSEQGRLRVLQGLINESFVDGKCKVSLNVEVLSRFVDNSGILDRFLDPELLKTVNPLLLVIQIMMLHFQLNRAQYRATFNFPLSQKAVYSSMESEPMFYGPNQLDINMPLIAHTLNFFKHHMTNPGEGLYSIYNSCDTPKVKVWNKRLVNGAQNLGKKWAGAYAYLTNEELFDMRENPAGELFVLDGLNGEDQSGQLQSLVLHFPEEPAQWPDQFEHHLHSLKHPSATYLASANDTIADKPAMGPRSRAQRRVNKPAKATRSRTQHSANKPNRTPADPPEDNDNNTTIDPRTNSLQFTGAGMDAERFYVSGWLNPLPAQEGIPGWQRITMMKYYSDADVFEKDGKFDVDVALGKVDEESMWAYEGVVLPGGQIVVGRWWAPSLMFEDEREDEWVYSGPFMFWCVD